mmetsp:Transcript_4732/g.7030  ORF Transcript_4732/g.7030 Transcript_4732/m.7030 type:complete len:205 (-) Transcript_4732:244-858(-)
MFNRCLRVVGVVDGTYSVIPQHTDEYTQSLYWTGYKKIHAYKLNVVCNPFNENEILLVGVQTGSTDDKKAYQQTTLPYIERKAIVDILGDKAYESQQYVVTYFREKEYSFVRAMIRSAISRHDRQRVTVLRKLLCEMHAFDKAIQKYRIRVEQSIGILKQWGFVRGRADARLKRSDEDMQIGFSVCAALCNYVNTLRHVGACAE